jgi:hypothetical protein
MRHADRGDSGMRVLWKVAMLLAVSSSAWGEVITTTDGRRIELNSDGTFKFIESASENSIQLTEREPLFEHYAGEYDRNSIRFMPIIKNETGKTVVGFKFRSVFRSAFGDEVFSFEGESTERVAPNSLSTASTFYYFEDNQFIGGQPYDKLSIFLSTNTGSISTEIVAVVFDGGEVVRAGQ